MSDSLILDYLNYHDQYVKKFNKDNTLILMQVGSFYEAYSTLDRGPNLEKLESITDVVFTRRNTSKTQVNLSNPLMWGFPLISATKYIEILIGHGYHIIIIDQVTPPPDPERKVVGIYSPGTYLDNLYRPNSNYIAGLFIEEIVQKNGVPLVVIGMSAVDCSTGEVRAHESYSTANDMMMGLDEAVRFLNSISPKEIIIFKGKFQRLTEQKIVEYLDISTQMFQFKDAEQEHQKIPFQRTLIQSIYRNDLNMSDCFEYLGIHKTIYCRNCFISLLVYIANHLTILITGLSLPVFHLNDKHLILGNDAIHQLNVVSMDNSMDKIGKKDKIDKMGKKDYRNLIDVINLASTNMGKRFINARLVSPLTDPQELQKIYEIAELFIKKNRYTSVINYLKNIKDIERMYRNIKLSTIHPMHMVELMESYSQIYQLFTNIKSFNDLEPYIDVMNLRKEINDMNKMLHSKIEPDKAKLFRINDIRENIFLKGVYPELDEMQNSIGMSHSSIQELLEQLDQSIVNSVLTAKQAKGKSGKKAEPKNNQQKNIILKHNNREGYYFQITEKRYVILEQVLAENPIIQLSNLTFNANELIIDRTTKVVKISAPFLKGQTQDIDALTQKITQLSHTHYLSLIKTIENSYGRIMEKTIELICLIDYYTTIAVVAKTYNYTKPIIEKSNNLESEDPFTEFSSERVESGHLIARDIRHPIVERIIDHEYIPHDIDLGIDLKGIMIYGLNSSGKSVLMKAIGLSIIMAQAGFYVPARQFKYYPYKALYTRITGNDNLFRGLSSFSLEMVELNAILRRADSQTLVIGDEVCKGTEHISGNALVAASLLKLSDVGASFVFATHLHELMELDLIKNRNNIRAFHLSVENSNDNQNLIYDRRLKPGTGERIYGITVAKYIIKDNDLINQALEIKNILLNKDTIPTKRSKYNTQIVMDRCTLCGLENTLNGPTLLETHHINEQQDCVDGFVVNKPHIPKNSPFNLMVCCAKCHDLVHSGKIDITGYRITGNGKQLIVKKTDGVIKNNVIKDNVIKDNVIKDNVIKDNVIKDNVIKDNVIKDNVIKKVKGVKKG